MRKNSYEKAFDIVNYTILSILGIICLYPIINVFAISFSSYPAYVRHPLMIFPREIELTSYERIFTNPLLISSYKNTVFVTIVGTLNSLLLTVMTAYPLAKSKVRGSRGIMLYIIFTMFFNGGIIPTYMVVKTLNLLDTLWALILPTAMSTYNFIIVRNFLETIPDSIEESAKIDGAGHIRILFELVIPLSKPVLATIALFYAVANWNRFFESYMYITQRSKWTLTLLLREIVSDNADIMNVTDPTAADTVFPKTMQCATIVATTLPILFSYPFLQRYFIKGIMLGAVKG
ncbi:MAG: carbohydrate ABC transporter permease [Clostridiaceae bacterium]|nr:carbohydrate ABC transporter permease [Clostridiaceae bacterium]